MNFVILRAFADVSAKLQGKKVLIHDSRNITGLSLIHYRG